MTKPLPHPLLQKSLENIAQNLPNFVSRPTQREMMAAIFNTFSATDKDEEIPTRTGESILVVEGPTGTGKSLGYLLPAIVAAKSHGKRLVVSSATVMLQEQLINKDIPFVAKHAGIPISYAIAKGRGRYACPQKLYQQTMQTAQMDFIGHEDNFSPWEKEPNSDELQQLKNLSHYLSANTWSGDRDTLGENVSDALWSRITNDRHGCLKRECHYFKSCPFYEARERLEKIDIIVVNHDLLLSDLSMGGGVILPAPENTFYCIDEAHHLSDKAIQQFSATHSIYGTITWLEKLHSTISKAESLLAEYGVTQKAQYAIETIRENLQTLGPALQNLFGKNLDVPIYRCPHGVLPEGFDTFCKQLLPAILALLKTLRNLLESLKRQKTKQEGKAHETLFTRLTVDLGFFTGRVENLQAVWKLFATDCSPNEPPIAKWITVESPSRGKFEYTLCASPVRAAPLLAERLWQKAAGAVLTSATLRSLGSFEKLLTETGLNYFPQTTCIALPSPFNLKEQGKLIIPRMKADPKNPEAHTREIINMLPDLISLDKNEGTLMLFGSKKQMLEVAESLPQRWRSHLLIQGNQPKEILIKTHFDRVKENKPSVLFGLSSFSEGLDLPGKACTHLIIAKLPFSMPDDPVSQTLAEWITLRGGNPFSEITLPEASIRLIQAMGRLIRSETDTGIITLLDTRLMSKAYGRLLKQSLPFQ